MNETRKLTPEESVEYEPLDSWWPQEARRRAGLLPVAELALEARRNTGRTQLTWRDLRIAVGTLQRSRMPHRGGRAARVATNGRRRGSRRCSSSRGSPDDSGDSDPDGEHHPLAVRGTAGGGA